MRRKAVRGMPRNVPLGDVFNAKFKIVRIENVNAPVIGGAQINPIHTWRFNDLDQVNSEFGACPGMLEASANFRDYNVRSVTIKQTFFPRLPGVASPNDTNCYYMYSYGGQIIPVVTSTEQMMENPNVTYTAVSPNFLGGRPVKHLSKVTLKKILPFSNITTQEEYSGTTTAAASPPFFNSPNNFCYAETGIFTINPTGFPGASVALGTIKTELFYNVVFYNRRYNGI